MLVLTPFSRKPVNGRRRGLVSRTQKNGEWKQKQKVLKMDSGVLELVHIIVTIRISEKKPAVMWEVFLLDVE